MVDLGRFAAAGHQIDIIVGNHDVELIAPEVADELLRQIRAAGADDRALARIRVLPWFIYEPGLCWIEHGHVYDEGCSFEFNLAPMDPKDGWLIDNADYCAIRYLGTAEPELDPHGIEEWSFWGYIQYGLNHGLGRLGKLWAAYARFVWALFRARGLHRSYKRRDRRRREHRTRLAQAAEAGGISFETASAIDRLARSPMTISTRRLGRMLMLDRFGLGLGAFLTVVILLILLPFGWALVGSALAIGAAIGITQWLGKHMVLSQLPMRAVPQRLRKLIDAPVVVFGHTHDPRWQRLRSGGIYVNAGTWLPATRPGLRRSFTHVFISPNPGAPPTVELRQWREGTTQPFDAGANLGAGGMTMPGLPIDETNPPGTAVP
jgi:hypothetical protein